MTANDDIPTDRKRWQKWGKWLVEYTITGNGEHVSIDRITRNGAALANAKVGCLETLLIDFVDSMLVAGQADALSLARHLAMSDEAQGHNDN